MESVQEIHTEEAPEAPVEKRRETSRASASSGVRECMFCRYPVPAGAVKCGLCGSNIGDIKICPGCAEPVRQTAIICPFCRADLRPPEPPVEAFLPEPWVIRASPLGAMLAEQSPTALFFPPELILTEREIHIRRRSLMGLRTLDQKISVSRIASVRALSGVIWGGLMIETYGGSAGGDLAINGLDKEDARETAKVVERLANLAPAEIVR